MNTQQQEILSNWQNGQPTEPGMYHRQFSVAEHTIFRESTDTKYFHYFDGDDWYVFGIDKEDAMREYKRGHFEGNAKYANVPWRRVLEVA